MAKIPNADDLTRAVPSGTRSISSAPQVSSIGVGVGVAGNVTVIGDALQQVGIDIDRINQQRKARKDRVAVAKAKGFFLTEQVKLDSSLQDDDYESYMQRYEEGSRRAMDGALEMVTDPETRELLQADLDYDTARGAAEIHQRVIGKERDFVRAENDALAAQLADQAALDPKRGHQAREAFVIATDAAMKSGAITRQEAGDRVRGFEGMIAVNRFIGLPSTEQVTVAAQAELDPNHWANKIPPDKRAIAFSRAREVGEVEKRVSAAQEGADRLLAKYGSGGAAIAAAKTEFSGELEDDVIRYIDQQHARQESNKAAASDALMVETLSTIKTMQAENPDLAFLDLPLPLIAKMDGRTASLAQAILSPHPATATQEHEAIIAWAAVETRLAKNPTQLTTFTVADAWDILKYHPQREAKLDELADLRADYAASQTPEAEATKAWKALNARAVDADTLKGARVDLAEELHADSKPLQAGVTALLDRGVAIFKDQNQGRMPTLGELDAIKDDIKKQWRIESGFWTWLLPGVTPQLVPFEAPEVLLPAVIGVPSDAVEQIMAEWDLRRANNPRLPELTPAQIKQVYAEQGGAGG